MNLMFGKFKISLIVLASIAATLAACRTIDTSTQVAPTPPPSNDGQGPGKLSQNAPGTTEGRSQYKTISLQDIKPAESLKGTDPKAIALKAFGQIESEGGSRQVEMTNPQPDKAVVTITQTGVADDSIGAIRYRVEFVSTSGTAQTGKQWQMVWAGSQQKCHVGRGHQDWSNEICR